MSISMKTLAFVGLLIGLLSQDANARGGVHGLVSQTATQAGNAAALCSTTGARANPSVDDFCAAAMGETA